MAAMFFVLRVDEDGDADEIVAHDAGTNYQALCAELRFRAQRVDLPQPLRYQLNREPTSVRGALFSATGMTLFSSAARDVIESHRGVRDQVQWLPATVTTPANKALDYHVLHTPRPPEVLDEAASTWAGPGRVIRWVLDQDRLEGLNVFRYSQAPMTMVIVRDSVWDALEAAGISGLEATRARVA